MNGLSNARVGSASADRIGHRPVDVVIGSDRLPRQQSAGCHQHPWLTVAALRDVYFEPGPLAGMGSVSREAFDGRELPPGGLVRRNLTGADRALSFEQSACSADAHAAAELRTSQS